MHAQPFNMKPICTMLSGAHGAMSTFQVTWMNIRLTTPITTIAVVWVQDEEDETPAQLAAMAPTTAWGSGPADMLLPIQEDPILNGEKSSQRSILVCAIGFSILCPSGEYGWRVGLRV